MQFQESIKTCFNKFSDFQGRASRSEFWWFVLFVVIANTVSNAIFKGGTIGMVIGVILFVPEIAAAVRRLHDIGKKGAWALLLLIPIANFLAIYWLIQKSEPTANAYGPVPADAEISATPV
jgi:uncharacterized membrane protein YhaH (DUF805 family)